MKRGKPTYVSKCGGAKRNSKQTFMPLEERISALQKIYDESGINLDAKEIYLKAKQDYEESHKKEILS